jgi:hypothetical protein
MYLINQSDPKTPEAAETGEMVEKAQLGEGTFGSVWLETNGDGNNRAVKEFGNNSAASLHRLQKGVVSPEEGVKSVQDSENFLSWPRL